MKKFLLIALAVVGFSIAGVSRADAGVSVGIGIGIPFGVGFGYPYGYGYCGYPAYYPYGYPYYGGYYGTSYVRVVHRPYYWHHGRRVYYRHRGHWR